MIKYNPTEKYPKNDMQNFFPSRSDDKEPRKICFNKFGANLCTPNIFQTISDFK